MPRRKVIHEITLIAFTRNEDGSRSIMDIVETSNHFASHFMRRWVRDIEIIEVETLRPGTKWPARGTIHTLAH